MYYSKGNYEAFARPLKPESIEAKKAWIVGSGLAGLSTAAFLVRDAQMPGKNITILEELKIPGGALDGIKEPEKGFVIRGGREMDSHFECLWDLFRSVPSIEEQGASVLDEFYWLNKRDPNNSLQRATIKQGQDAGTGKLFTLSEKAQLEIMKLFLATRAEVENKRIDQVFSQAFFKSNFWLYWQTMFAFQTWHSALEMKLYLHRFVNHIKGMPDFSTLKFTKYNEYESLILPLKKWLEDQGVTFQYNTKVQDVDFDIEKDKKTATFIHWVKDGEKGYQSLGSNDLVFMTIGSLTENSASGDHQTPAKLDDGPAPAWDLWRRIAAKDPLFGRPGVFCDNISATKWMSATVTTLDKRIPEYIQQICKRDPFSGKVVTGGIVTARDSSWIMNWTVNRQPHFKNQPEDQIVVWVYGLLVEKDGDYVKKPMQDCTGEEITQEWLYHLGVPESDIPDLAVQGAKCVPVMMPYVTSLFMPRQAGDRPDIVPAGAENFAFIGQFAETTRDTIFTTEYSVRTGMESVYQLTGVDRGVPEVFGSTYDVRVLLDAMCHLRDGKELATWLPERIRKFFVNKLERSQIGQLMHEYHLI
ncbi:myosin-crossreactive antigen [Fusarium oxysporum f. sp. lycopersici 4287]|uniref:Myosin-crossreactive antigen n=2 Tax=Fusarium oxysporum TaxID=5507 RepID=A0A0J9V6Q7_FUSO4|nr:myosin-crossreactive antigen [Fusarium oxysporum f. sp. lycopersici 4287]XP_018242661.1 myosin-crossreactive antigen [Fusarium oxysporum f. sp. lycopersici 4287]XP_018244596.1 myosin-crossreactive antigen [Fusarium oxysporum f. sp. lycopersici 4287]KAJ9419350.1 myosin-crossreactive antigen [Fusarium oxysporum]KNB04514.1 myosin-crossreactive antigen [Fusarium oxysporum f. sp. lycopersici 4287]KNB04616.1 myosin-crossreactive antigen [Fusarium oxysporum f. sp. lycopersici 4287]KNB06551.1 myos